MPLDRKTSATEFDRGLVVCPVAELDTANTIAKTEARITLRTFTYSPQTAGNAPLIPLGALSWANDLCPS
jgi:hypothetical protein